MNLLKIKKLNTHVENNQILKEIDFNINSGEIHAILGPNGAGKSTFLKSIMGLKELSIKANTFTFKNKNILNSEINERSKAGIFLAWQNPPEVEGLNQLDFFKFAINAHRKEPIALFELYKLVNQNIEKLKLNANVINRYLNVGFSGGEKKKNEILQLLFLLPSLALLDEIDSGLDVDAIKQISKILNEFVHQSKCSLIIVSHNDKLLNYLKPTHLHVMINGQLISKEPLSSIKKIQKDGYQWLVEKYNLNNKAKPVKRVQSIGACAVRGKK